MFFFFKQKTAYEIGLGIPAEPLFRSAVGGKRTSARVNIVPCSGTKKRGTECLDRKSGSAGMPRPISYAVFCLKKKIGIEYEHEHEHEQEQRGRKLVQNRSAHSQSR